MNIDIGKLKLMIADRQNEDEKDRAHWVGRTGEILAADIGRNMVFKYEDENGEKKVCSAKGVKSLRISDYSVEIDIENANFVFAHIAEEG